MRILKLFYRWPEFIVCARTFRRWPHWMRIYVARRESVFPDSLETVNGLRFRLDDWSELSTVWRVLCANEYLVPNTAVRIIDAGANIGAFSAKVAASNPNASIVACEPFAKSYQHLLETIASNHLEQRIRPHELALASKSGVTTFDGRPHTKSYCRKIVDSDQPDVIRVNTISLPELLDQQGWDVADYLKMDIEGGEYDALLSLPPDQLRRFQAVGLEYHDSARANSLFEHFQQCRFECIRHAPAGWSGLAEFRRIP